VSRIPSTDNCFALPLRPTAGSGPG
jgi:hypothetical protein